MRKLDFTLEISPQVILIFALIYYGLSIYVDVFIYDVTEVPIFLNYQKDFVPSFEYFYSWFVPISMVSLFLYYIKISSAKKLNLRHQSPYRNTSLFLIIGFLVYFFILLVIMPSSPNRAAVLLEINENYQLISYLLPITIWCCCFSIIDSKTSGQLFLPVLLVLLLSLTLVDRSYLLMGTLAFLMRFGKISIIKLSIFALSFIFLMTFWKVVLFWLVFDIDLGRSLENIQPGLARFEAITSQSIFINCIDFQACSRIPFNEFFSSSIGRILPSFLYNGSIESTQARYITEFFPEIANRGVGLGYSLLAEFNLVVGNTIGPWVLTLYLFLILFFLRYVRSDIANFILAAYFFRFLRVDFATGIKGIIVFGIISFCLYWILTRMANLRIARYNIS